MDWLVLPLAMTFCGGALGGSSGRDTLAHGQRESEKRSETDAAFGPLLRVHVGGPSHPRRTSSAETRLLRSPSCCGPRPGLDGPDGTPEV